MKLVEILGMAMINWPNDAAKLITQDADGSICPCNDTGDLEFNGNRWCAGGGFIYGMDILPGQPLADDYRTAIVTRAQWEAEKMKQAKPAEQENKWIRHRGGKCPVEDRQYVEVRCRDGSVHSLYGDEAFWSHGGKSLDIMAYRLHKPEQQEESAIPSLQVPAHMLFGYTSKEAMKAATGCETLQEIAAMMASDTSSIILPGKQYIVTDDPRTIRDRIREIDTTVESLEEERASLIQRLEDEGFKLVRADAKVSPKEPDADMSDWRNWRADDIVTFVHESDYAFTNGKQYTVSKIHPESQNQISVAADDEGDHNGWQAKYFKFHSRP